MRRRGRWRSFEQEELDSVRSEVRLEQIYLPPLRKAALGPKTQLINPFIRRIRAALTHPNSRKASLHLSKSHNFSNSDLAEASLREGMKGMNHALKLQMRPYGCQLAGKHRRRTNSTVKIEVYLGRPKELQGWDRPSVVSRETSMDY